MQWYKKPKTLLALFVFLASLITYLRTIAPTTSFWDCGEFIACSYTLGIPHPPGAPLYILVGRIFSIIPFAADIGLRVNLISALLSSFSAMFTFLIIIRFLEMMQGKADTVERKIIQYTGGVVGALAFAFSDSQWFNSVEAEVYSGSLFFTAIVVWLILKWADQNDRPEADKWIVLIFYFIGLALGVHLLNVLALPTIFLIMFFQQEEASWERFIYFAMGGALAFVAIYPGVVKGIPHLILEFSFWGVGVLMLLLLVGIYQTISKNKREWALIFISLFLVLVGYSTYSAIYIRSSLNPTIDENDPDTPQKFVSYLNREQYGDWSITERRAPLWEYQIKKMYIRYFGWQFIGKGANIGPDGLISDTIAMRGLWGLPFLLGLIGMIHQFNRDWRRASSVLALFIMTGLAIVFYLNQEDPQPRERDYAYTGSFFAFAIWIGIGAAALIEFAQTAMKTSQNRRKPIMALLAVLLVLAIPGRMYSFNFPTHKRTGNYVAFDYSYNILQSCEPNALIFTNGDNDTFPLWFLQTVYGIRTDVRIINLSLLNTGWYIKQLRDFEPKVPITYTDAEIDRLAPQPWKASKLRIPVPRDIYNSWVARMQAADSTYKPTGKPEISFELKPTLYGQGIRVQDIMIVHILGANKFERPVYFAVTVADENKIGLHDYLRMDGLAFRVLPVSGARKAIDPEIIRTNLFEKYQYRNLNNKDVYYPDNVIALLGNYRSAFLTLAQYYQYKGEPEKALEVLDRMSEVMPEEVIPPTSPNLSLLIGQMYRSAGRPEELKKRLDLILERSALTGQQKLSFLPYYSQVAGDRAAAESLALAILKENPDLTEGYSFLVNSYRQTGRFKEALATIRDWLQVDPDNSTANNLQRDLQSKLEQQKADTAHAPADTTKQQ